MNVSAQLASESATYESLIFVGDVLNKPFRCSICGKVVKPVEEIRGWD
jgi:hypothetical protein